MKNEKMKKEILRNSWKLLCTTYKYWNIKF